jgi:ATP-dependent exoDNAse (exonuclease V) beta subunit
MGVHALYEREQSIRLSDEERLALIRDNTRKLYMACTRAGQRLVITYAGQLPDSLVVDKTAGRSFPGAGDDGGAAAGWGAG